MTPKGADKVVFGRMEAREAMSENFEFAIEALSKDDVDFDELIGKNCCVKYNSYDGIKRYYNGVLVEAQWTGFQHDLFTFRLVLRPWFWLLTHTQDCRFFQEMTAPDIIRQVFSEAGFSDFEMKLSRSYPEMEYCVQYRETHHAFVSRLMEEHGIYYFYRHSEDKHVMVLADGPGAHEPLPGGLDREYIPLTNAYVREAEHIQHLTAERRFRTGKSTLNDYDFQKPGAKLEADGQAAEKYARSKLEIYDYPGRYTERGQGTDFAKVRLDAMQSVDYRRIAAGECASAHPGARLKIKGHARDRENIEYLVIGATHTVTNGTYQALALPDEGPSYYGSYVLVPFSRPYRAPIVTPKPIIHGIQTAKVVGESGEEITVDKYGRIKVQFHWDRKKKQSCWIRVAEVWSGKQWGAVFHPRHGMEVVVDFLEGDPDRPLCIGTVYNADNMVPYPLPDNKTMNGWKTNSSKGGGGYNEFVYEDKKGSEKIRMHAEKDHEVKVRHAETWNIGETFEIPKGSPSRDTTIEKGDDNLEIKLGDQNVKIPIGDQKNTFGLNRSTTIGLTDTTKVGISLSETVGVSHSLNAGVSASVITGVSITLQAGPSSIIMSPAGIQIIAPTILLTGGVTTILGKAPAMTFVGGQVIVA
ncbi:type VI secretion system Vgr family protein [Prosthecomicrobium sp. N25]|uniref:type VI secretion system Vgr family protein n=1 Tax=Prosthecomicrobium sp. N25 TaxID=3129254 RepID=UPI003077AA2D